MVGEAIVILGSIAGEAAGALGQHSSPTHPAAKAEPSQQPQKALGFPLTTPGPTQEFWLFRHTMNLLSPQEYTGSKHSVVSEGSVGSVAGVPRVGGAPGEDAGTGESFGGGRGVVSVSSDGVGATGEGIGAAVVGDEVSIEGTVEGTGGSVGAAVPSQFAGGLPDKSQMVS
jgi:hypothetical protein